MINVAVYGSLKKGLHNHHLLKSIRAKGGLVTSISGFDLYPYYDSMFPCIVRGTGCVEVEVYSIDEEDLEILDTLEGYPHFYKRCLVTTNLGTLVWIYYHEEPPSTEIFIRFIANSLF